MPLYLCRKPRTPCHLSYSADLCSCLGSPGFGFPSSIAPGQLQVNREAEWGETLPLVLETKCPLFVTGFSPKDVERDVQALGAYGSGGRGTLLLRACSLNCPLVVFHLSEGLPDVDGRFDWLINPGENHFASEKWEVAELVRDSEPFSLA